MYGFDALFKTLGDWLEKSGDRQIVISARDPQMGGGFHVVAEDGDAVVEKEQARRGALMVALVEVAEKLREKA